MSDSADRPAELSQPQREGFESALSRMDMVHFVTAYASIPEFELTGKIPRSWGSVLLGALPRPVIVRKNAADFGGVGQAMAGLVGQQVGVEPGDPGDHSNILAMSDEIQASGDPLGEWLALLLERHPDIDRHANAIAERLDALTWITDRLPAPDDLVELDAALWPRSPAIHVRVIGRITSVADGFIWISTSSGKPSICWDTVRWRYAVEPEVQQPEVQQ